MLTVHGAESSSIHVLLSLLNHVTRPIVMHAWNGGRNIVDLAAASLTLHVWLHMFAVPHDEYTRSGARKSVFACCRVVTPIWSSMSSKFRPWAQAFSSTETCGTLRKNMWSGRTRAT